MLFRSEWRDSDRRRAGRSGSGCSARASVRSRAITAPLLPRLWILMQMRPDPHPGALEPALSFSFLTCVCPAHQTTSIFGHLRAQIGRPESSLVPPIRSLLLSSLRRPLHIPQLSPPDRQLQLVATTQPQHQHQHQPAPASATAPTHTMGYLFALDLGRYSSPLPKIDEQPLHRRGSYELDCSDSESDSASSSPSSSLCCASIPPSPRSDPLAPNSNQADAM